jgi:hypothetical protein
MKRSLLILTFGVSPFASDFIAAQTETSRNPTPLAKSALVSPILRDAQRGERPIRIVEFEGQGSPQYSGETKLDDPTEILIRISRNLPRETAENNLIHELFHVILFKEGFRFTAGSFRFAQAGDTGPLYAAIAKQLTNCFVDPLVDVRMLKRGLRPDLVTQLTAGGLASTKESDLITSSRSTLSIPWTSGVALQLYCVSLRPGRFRMSDVERSFAGVPAVLEAEHDFARAMGDPHCDTPGSCFERMKRLRDVAGMKEEIGLMNPGTGRYE